MVSGLACLDPAAMLRRSAPSLFRTVLGASLLFTPACEDPPASGTSETSDTMDSEDTGADTSTGDDVVGFLEVGFGETDFTPIEDGGELRVVWGAQGAAMFPMPIRAGGITVPDDPRDYTDPLAPLLDVTLDIEGEEPGYCGHFKCVSNYPMSFDVRQDGTLEFLYIRVIMPDGVDVQSLDGKAARLEVELSPYDSGSLVQTFDLTVVAEPPPF